MRARYAMMGAAFVGVVTGSSMAAPGAAPRSSLLNINIAGHQSWDLLGDPANDVVTVDMAAMLSLPSGTPVTITGMGWNISLTSFSPSWLSEATINIRPDGASPSAGFDFAPGILDQFSGNGSYISTVQSMASLGGSNIVLPTGMLSLEFFETLDDFVNQPDAEYHSTLVFEVVPEPATLALMLAIPIIRRTRRR